MDILKTNPIEHKGAKIKVQNPNTDYMEIISLGKDYSSGFYSKIELVEGEEYDLEIIGELVDGDGCFLYCELEDGIQVIPRNYYYTRNEPIKQTIRFTALSNSINIGILFNNINKKYKLYLQRFYITKYVDPLKTLLQKDIPICNILDMPSLNRNNPSVSIIIPVYNGFPLIQAAIRSILRQTFSNWELIIVDDGSNVYRKELLDFYEFIKRSKRVKVILLENNVGIPTALNKGLEYVDGTYWTWTSHDNFLTPNALAVIMNKFNLEPELDFIYSGWRCIGNQNRVIYGKMYTREDIMNSWEGVPFGIWNKRVLEFVGRFDEELHGIEDWEYIIRTFQYCRIDYISEVLFVYYSHGDSLTAKIGDYTDLREKMCNRILEKNLGYTNYTLYLDKYRILDDLEGASKHIETVSNLTRGLYPTSKIKKTVVYRSSVDFWTLLQRPQQFLRFLGTTDKIRTIFVNNGPIKRPIIHKKFILIDREDFEKYKEKLMVGERIYYFNDPDKIYLANTIKPHKIVFDLIDNPVEEFSVWKTNLEYAIKNSDILLYSHTYLKDVISKIDNTKSSYYVSNGCDYEYFNRARERIYPRPLDLPVLKPGEKLLGYYGAFASWLDYDFLKSVADRNNVKIVMIGGLRGGEYDRRFVHKNITWLDHKGYSDLSRYLSWFDECLLPFKDTEMIRGCNPLKMYEYLAAGKSIIGTAREEEIVRGIKDARDYSYKLYSNKLLNTIFSMKNYDKVYSKDIVKSKPAIFVYPMIDYDFRIQRNQHLANYFSRNGYRVYYVRSRLETIECDFSKSYLTHEKFDYKRREIMPNLFEISLACNVTDINVYNSKLTSLEIFSMRKSLEYVIKCENIEFSISNIGNPFWYQLVSLVRNTCVIYDCADYLKGFNNVSDHILDVEDKLIEGCDILVATSEKLIDKLKVKRDYTLIKNGCEYNYFNTILPSKLDRKIVGYYGAISDWFNVDVILNSIKKYPDVDFHFIGNVYCLDKEHESRIKELSKYPNVKLLGEIPYSELYLHICKFNVGLIPFTPNELIECTNPVKFYEMMTLGIPIVTTNLVDADLLANREMFYYSEDMEMFVENIGKALEETKDDIVDKRKTYGRMNDWNFRGKQLEALVAEKTPLISVVLLCYNNIEYTKECLKYYDTLTRYPNNELVIVDNMSTDGSREFLKEYLMEKTNNIRLVANSKNYGFSGGNNKGLEMCRGDYIVMLNNDTCPLDSWLYELVKPIIRDKKIGLVSPQTNEIGNEGKFFINFSGIEDLRLKVKEYNNRNELGLLDVTNVAFFCVAMSREIYEKIGPMDNMYGIGWFEDDDYCYRVKKDGYKIVINKNSFIYHKGSATMNIIPDNKKELFDRNKNYYQDKFNITWTPHIYSIKKYNIYCSDTIIESVLKKDKFLVLNSDTSKNSNIYDFYISSNGRNINSAIKYNTLVDFKYTKLEYNSSIGKKVLDIGNKDILDDTIYNFFNEIYNNIYI
jgi:GT2 family glycosyltransferase